MGGMVNQIIEPHIISWLWKNKIKNTQGGIWTCTMPICPFYSRKSLRHWVFPGGPPSKYYPGPTMLNFRDQMRTGAFNMIWPQTRFWIGCKRTLPPALIQKENINFACDIMYSQVVTHLSTNMTKCSLNSLIGKHRPNWKYKLIARLL